MNYPGMTLLDYFAGQALAGYCADQTSPYVSCADSAYQMADAMIAEKRRREAGQ